MELKGNSLYREILERWLGLLDRHMFGANFLDFNCGNYIAIQGGLEWLGVLEVFFANLCDGFSLGKKGSFFLSVFTYFIESLIIIIKRHTIVSHLLRYFDRLFCRILNIALY